MQCTCLSHFEFHLLPLVTPRNPAWGCPEAPKQSLFVGGASSIFSQAQVAFPKSQVLLHHCFTTAQWLDLVFSLLTLEHYWNLARGSFHACVSSAASEGGGAAQNHVLAQDRVSPACPRQGHVHQAGGQGPFAPPVPPLPMSF